MKDLFDKTKKIIKLTDKDFKNNIVIKSELKNNNGLLLVYANWCSHCQQMKEPWIQLSIISDKTSICVLSSEKYPEVVENLKVKGFPTIFEINKNGKLKMFSGNRDLLNLTNTLCNLDKKNKVCK